MRILFAILMFFLLVVLHEWGHFVIARYVGVPIYEFSIGFGPLLSSYKRREIQYSIRGIPLGGFVRMEDGIENGDIRGYNYRKPFEKIAISIAGPMMNFIIAIMIMIMIYSVIGVERLVDEPVFGEIAEDTPAEVAELYQGDRCLSINGKTLQTWNDFVEAVNTEWENDVAILHLEIERDGKVLYKDLKPEYSEELNRYIIGVYANTEIVHVSFLKAIPMGILQITTVTMMMMKSLFTIVTGTTPIEELSGPIGIASMVSDAARDGMVTLLSLMALLSANLGLMNLLPIPGLDGSKILFAIVEKVRRQRIDPNKEASITWIGFIFLIALFVFVTFQDIGRLLGFE